MAKALKKPLERKKLSKVRLGVIGCGGMANNVHLPSFSSYDDVEIVALSDISEKALKDTSEKYRVSRCYADYQKMVEECKPDAVLAVGQPEIMFKPIYWCFEKGLHIYTEKPLGMTIHQARLLAYAAEKNHCITQVSFQRRIAPLAVKMREECLKHGPIFHAVCEYYKCELSPYALARDHLMNDGVHAIDTLRWICGGEVVGIQSEMKSIGVVDKNCVVALLHFDNGATAVTLNTWASGRRIFRLGMHSPCVAAELDIESMGYIYEDGDTTGVEYDTRKVAGSDELYVYGGFQAKNREFIDAVRTGTQPGSSFADAVKTMEVAEKILAQSLLS